MKRERTLQVVLALVGLFYSADLQRNLISTTHPSPRDEKRDRAR
jgi:hypothetical protein